MNTQDDNMNAKMFLRETGYDQGGVSLRHIKDLEDGTYVLAKTLLFHWTLIRGDFADPIGYFDRWCYATEEKALAALDAFPIKPDSHYEPDGWHRHPSTARRRVEGDPKREYIDG